MTTEFALDFAGGREPESVVETGQLADLDLIQSVIAPHQQQPDHGLRHRTRAVTAVIRCEDQRLDRSLQRECQATTRRLRRSPCLASACFASIRSVRDGSSSMAPPRRVRCSLRSPKRGCRRSHPRRCRRSPETHASRSPPIAPVSAATARNTRPIRVEDANVGVVHALIAEPGARHVTVERVGVLHRELAPPHHAETRTPLVAEFGLDVIEILRQRAIAAEFLPRDVGDDLFARRLNDEIALVAILQAKQFGTVLLKAPALLPEALRAARPASAIRPPRLDSSRRGRSPRPCG